MLDSYRLRMAALGSYEGEARRRNAQNIMDASWMRDPATRPVYVKWVDSGLPDINEDDEPVYAKYNVKSYHNITGDEIAYLLQFRLEDMKNNPNIEHTPFGLHAVVPAREDNPAGVVYVLKNRNNGVNIDHKNRLHPFYMVYITNDGNVVCDHLSPKAMLDRMRYICRGKLEPIPELYREFNKGRCF